MIKWVSRELGRPCRLHRDCRLEPRLTNSRLIHSSLVPSWWGRTGDEPMVSPSEGNEARRDGRQGVAAPIVVLKRGRRPSPDPVERRGCRVVDGELEPRRGRRASSACHRETTQSCEGQRFHSVTNRVHLTCTPGSVGGLGGRPPRSTRARN